MSVKDKIYITEFDLKRLRELIKYAEERWDKRVAKYLEELDEELDRAEIVKPEETPTDVITMNSTVRLRDLETGERETYTLVYPEHADIAANKLSILAPIGTAILGYRVGNVVSWRVPSGSCQIEIEDLLYQPEREQAVSL